MLGLHKKKKWITDDKKIRKIFLKYEIKKKVIKSLMYNKNSTIDQKYYFDFKYKKFPYTSSISKARTNCVFIGNNKSIFKKFKMSRDIFKKYASYGFITGIRKASF